jgi:hypothetical protein
MSRSIASITRQSRPRARDTGSETQEIPYGSQTIHPSSAAIGGARQCAALNFGRAAASRPIFCSSSSTSATRRSSVRHQRRQPVSRQVHAEHLRIMAKRRQVRQPTYGEHRLQPGARCACHRSLLASELGDPDDQGFPGYNQQRATGAEAGLPDLRQIAAPGRLSDALHRQMAHIDTKCQQGRADGLRL